MLLDCGFLWRKTLVAGAPGEPQTVKNKMQILNLFVSCFNVRRVTLDLCGAMSRLFTFFKSSFFFGSPAEQKQLISPVSSLRRNLSVHHIHTAKVNVL